MILRGIDRAIKPTKKPENKPRFAKLLFEPAAYYK
jgi:hypothetical protein